MGILMNCFHCFTHNRNSLDRNNFSYFQCMVKKEMIEITFDLFAIITVYSFKHIPKINNLQVHLFTLCTVTD